LRSTPFPIEPRPIYVELRFVQPTCPEITTWVGGYLYCRLTLDIRSDSSFQEGLVRLGMIVAPIVRLVEPRLEKKLATLPRSSKQRLLSMYTIQSDQSRTPSGCTQVVIRLSETFSRARTSYDDPITRSSCWADVVCDPVPSYHSFFFNPSVQFYTLHQCTVLVDGGWGGDELPSTSDGWVGMAQ
jgi:hypothetical protein